MRNSFNIISPLTKLARVDRTGPVIMKSGDGIFITDSSGKQLIDNYSSGWSVGLGHGRKELAEVAVAQYETLPMSSSMYGYSHEPAIALADKLIEITPNSLNRIYFSCGGSDANDTAIKLIFMYNNLLARPQKKNIITIKDSYHGLTLAASGLTGIESCHDFFDLPFRFNHYIDRYHPFRSAYGKTDEEIISGTILALKNKLRELGADTVAAILVEPFLQTGGAIFPPGGWLKAIQDFCNDNDIIFWVDEVISGFGRTGKMFCSNHEGIEPDLMAIAKGLTNGYATLGALMVSDKIYDPIIETMGEETFFQHGSTGAGHPVATAIAKKSIEILENEQVIENSAKMGAYLLKRLQDFYEYNIVGNVRGMGMVAAVELVTDRETMTTVPAEWNVFNLIRQSGYEHGVTLRAYEHANIVFAPPLVMTKENIDLLVNRAKAAFEAIIPQLNR